MVPPRIPTPESERAPEKNPRESASFFLLLFLLRTNNRHFKCRRCNLALLPIWEGNGDLGLAVACLAWDSHGAEEITCSVSIFVENDLRLERETTGVLMGKFCLTDHFEVFKLVVVIVDRCT